MATTEILTVDLSKETIMALLDNGAYIGETRKNSDNNFVSELCVEIDDYAKTFDIEYNGTEKGFIENAIDELAKYNPVEDTIELIVNGDCENLNDITNSVDMMKEFDGECYTLMQNFVDLQKVLQKQQ